MTNGEPNTRTLALCYLRLSNRGRQEVSIEMQRQRCLTECQRLALTPVFFEEGLGKHSANSRKRLPQWDALLERALSDPLVYCVMAYDHERAFRNVPAARSVADELTRHGVKLIFTTSGEVDTRTASGKMMYTMNAAFAEHYSNYISEKLTHHFEELKARGIYAGHRAPYGLRRIGKAPDISFEKTDDFAVIVEWFRLYTSEEIGTIRGTIELNKRSLRWRDRYGKLRPVRPDDLIQALNAVQHYKPFLPAALYRAVRRTIGERAQHKKNSRPIVHPPLPLRGLLFCALCGEAYVSATQPDRYGHIHSYYRHRPGYVCSNVVKPSASRIHAQLWAQLAMLEWSTEDKHNLVALLAAPPETGTPLDVRQLREKLERRLRNLETMLADEDIIRPTFLAHRAAILDEMKALPQTTLALEEPLNEAEAWALVNRIESELSDPTSGTPLSKNRALRMLLEKVLLRGTRGAYQIELIPQPLFAFVLNSG